MSDMTENNVPHVIIVGAGFGGLNAARALRKAPVRVTLIDRNNHHLFQPLLYQVATAGLSAADIAYPIRSVLTNQQNAETVMAEVTGVDTVQKRVWMHDLSLPYDYLILATGATDNYFGHDEWAEHAPGLKTIMQATDIRRHILLAFEAAELETEFQCPTNQEELERDVARRKSYLTFVLVGGGPTGVEMAGAIAELSRVALAADFRHIDPASTRIILVDAGPRILATFPEELARKAQLELERKGVEVHSNAKVEMVDEEGVIVNGERIYAKNVIWAAGVKASPAAKWLGVEADRGGRVKVNPDLSVPGLPEVFVIGDTAHAENDGKPLPGVAQVAIQSGGYVTRVIKARIAGRQEPGPFSYFDKGNLATVGRSFAILDSAGIRLSGFIAWLAWLGVHVTFLIGFRNRISVMMQWVAAYLTYSRGARLISSGQPPLPPGKNVPTLPPSTPASTPAPTEPTTAPPAPERVTTP
ncbi:MAG: NAD(P)/FAD-dependent oxidoreductase [Chthonomonadaceae bacterium]|nr:NAD(P)/FAD-dependent oxidoreductase [Chthonomonadaceae bacterium]